MDITWKPELAKVSVLKLWEENPRTISEIEYNALKKSIIDRGFHDCLKVNTDMTILSGNMRKRALEELTITEVYVMKPSRTLTSDEMTRIALESNKHRGQDDWDKLASFDLNLLKDVGFDDKELQFNLGLGEDSESLGYVITCPHCSGKIKSSNRVKNLEAIGGDIL